MSRRRALTGLAVAAFASGLVACGGGDGGGGSSDADPAEVIEATFDNDRSIESGVFEASFELATSEGEGDERFEATLGGPFQTRGDEVPEFDVDASVTIEGDQDLDFEAGLTSTGDAAFVGYSDEEYEIPQQAFEQFAASFTQLQQREGDSPGSLGGIDFADALTDLRNEGTEDVEGTETVHVSASADVAKLSDAIERASQLVGPAARSLTPDELSQFEDSIESAEIDVYSGTEDDLLRRLDVDLELNAPEGAPEGTPPSAHVSFSLVLSELNDPQSVTAPSDPRPITELLDEIPLDLGGLGAIGAGGSSGGGAAPSDGDEAPAPSGDAATQAYIDCLAAAQGAAETQACAELLQ